MAQVIAPTLTLYQPPVFSKGEIKAIYGGEDWMTRATEADSLGWAYADATRALGFRMNRHEGKLIRLSAMGKPIFADEIGSHFRVDDDGRVRSDFRDRASALRAHSVDI
jgi:carbamoyltransferase